MANQEQLNLLKQGVEAWNQWRQSNPTLRPDLSGADLSEMRLSGIDLNWAILTDANLRQTHLDSANLNLANLRQANLVGAILWNATLREAGLAEANLSPAFLSDADLSGADFSKSNLSGAELERAILTNAVFDQANLNFANLNEAQLDGAYLVGVNLSEAKLNGAKLRAGTDLSDANLSGAELNDADLSNAKLDRAIFVKAKLNRAILTGSSIFGVSAWGVELEGAVQQNLRITPSYETAVTVDNLEVAQFTYLLLNNQKIRDVINTIGQKAVLILGRFSPERKAVLDAIADRLREKNYLPIIFDFGRAQSRDITETIKILAGLSLFVISDITNPKSNPLELQATVPDYMIPFVPIIQKGEEPFAMFADLGNKYDWVIQPVVRYSSQETLLARLDELIIKPALELHNKLLARKAQQLMIVDV